MKKMAGVILMTAMVAVTLTGPGTVAHSGLGGTIYNLGESGLLQVETYSAIPWGCDPTSTGEHTIWATDILDVTAVKIPQSHCMVAWWDMKTSHATKFLDFRLRVDEIVGQAASHDQSWLIRMWVDDGWANSNLVAEGLATLAPEDGFQIFPFTTSQLMPVNYAYRTVKVQAIAQGDTPATADVWLDWIRHKGQCLNLAPYLHDIKVDGLVNGLIGWTGLDPLSADPFAYTFDIRGARDPNGDPFEIIVEWSDGTPATVITSSEYADGLTAVTRSFDLEDPLALVPEVVSFVVSIVDDPSLRCLEDTVDALYQSLPLDFVVVPDLLPTLLSPLSGFSCHAGEIATTWTESGLDTIFGNCPASAQTTSAGFPPGSIQGEIRTGGVTFGTASATEIHSIYDATRVADGLQELEGCFWVPGDKYGRDFCSEPFLFESKKCTNSPPQLDGIIADGMVAGLHVWLGMPYTFTAQVSDLDGDAVTIEWVWQDQPSDFGATATRSFYTPGGHPFSLRITEDLSGRCADAPTKEVQVHGNMVMAVDDWTALLKFPREGMSCIGDRYVPTWIGLEQDIMASSCNVNGMVEIAAPGMESVVRGSLLLDGQTIWQGASSAISTSYNSLNYQTEEKTFSTCFEADGDKYDRVFCSTPFEFLNIGR